MLVGKSLRGKQTKNVKSFVRDQAVRLKKKQTLKLINYPIMHNKATFLIRRFWKSIHNPVNFHLSLGGLDFAAKASYVLSSYSGWSTVSQIESLLELVRTEQNIYNIVFHEVIRQVTVSCTERGQLLEKLRSAGRSFSLPHFVKFHSSIRMIR